MQSGVTCLYAATLIIVHNRCHFFQKNQGARTYRIEYKIEHSQICAVSRW